MNQINYLRIGYPTISYFLDCFTDTGTNGGYTSKKSTATAFDLNSNKFPKISIDRIITLDKNTGEKVFYRYQFAVAGYSKDDISIKIDGHLLTVRTKKIEDSDIDKTADPTTEISSIYNEITRKGFSREIMLFEMIDTKTAKASYENGILTIEFEELTEYESDIVIK
jgi:HSP20 family molecular chaperone IbpA